MTGSPGRILILGAGPTGLGAAWRLQELGYHDYQILEQSSEAGGLASSFVDHYGFTWDVGGHVQFSHYAYYDDVLDLALGDAWLYHQRESWVWMRERFIPYPFQNNIHRLDPADCARALRGMEAAAVARDGTRPAEWLAPAIAVTTMLQPEDIAAAVIDLVESDAVGEARVVRN